MRKVFAVLVAGGLTFYVTALIVTMQLAKRPVFETIVPKSTTGTIALDEPRSENLADASGLRLQPELAASLPVVSADGQEVGRVAGVTEGLDGATHWILVETGGFLGLGGRTVRLGAGVLSLEADKVRVALSSREIEQLPEAAHAR